MFVSVCLSVSSITQKLRMNLFAKRFWGLFHFVNIAKLRFSLGLRIEF